MKTKSEDLFERFLEANHVPFERIEEATSPRPAVQRKEAIAPKKQEYVIQCRLADCATGPGKRM
jgi:hypothetical protein